MPYAALRYWTPIFRYEDYMKTGQKERKKLWLPGLWVCLPSLQRAVCTRQRRRQAAAVTVPFPMRSRRKEQLETALQEAQGLITELQNSQEDAETKIAELDQKMSDISDQMTGLEQKLDEKNSEISDTETLLAQSEENAAAAVCEHEAAHTVYV